MWTGRRPAIPISLGPYLDVDFEIDDLQWIPDPKWRAKLENGELSLDEFSEMAAHQSNVVIEIQIKWRVVKP